MKYIFFRSWICLLLALFTGTLQAKKTETNAQTSGQTTATSGDEKCALASNELKSFLEKNVSKNFPPNWIIASEVETDFDNDQQPDHALLVKRNFPETKDTDSNFEQNLNYLVVFLSNKGKPIAVFPKAPTSPVPGSESMNETLLKLKNNKVLEVEESVASSTGSWTAESASYKWRYHNKDFRLIGYTYSVQQRSKPFPEKIVDRNLATGKEVRFDSMPLEDYFYESGEFQPTKPASKKELSPAEEDQQKKSQLSKFRDQLKKQKDKSILKSAETQEEWIKVKTESTETPRQSVLLSQFGSCDFSLETAY